MSLRHSVVRCVAAAMNDCSVYICRTRLVCGLEALPPRGGGSAECPKKDRRRVRRGSREQKPPQHTNQSE